MIHLFAAAGASSRGVGMAGLRETAPYPWLPRKTKKKREKKPQFPSFEKQKAEQILSHTVLDRYVESSTSIICTRSRSLSFPLFPFFFSSVNLGSYLIPEFIPFFIIAACNSGHGLDATRLCYASLLLIAITYSNSELSFYILFEK